jgi:hypothetical protein
MHEWDTTRHRPAPSPAAARREAVRTAEQTVNDAWIGQLLLAEAESEATAGACARVRDRAVDRVRSAQCSGDLVALVQAQSELERADRVCEHAALAYDDARDRLARELADWTDATAQRARQAWADRPAAGHR